MRVTEEMKGSLRGEWYVNVSNHVIYLTEFIVVRCQNLGRLDSSRTDVQRLSCFTVKEEESNNLCNTGK